MQLTLNFDAGLAESYATGREVVQARVHHQGRPVKAIAADMDYSPSQLQRKLAQSPGDSARFTLDDAELFFDVTADYTLIYYLVEKYLAQEDEIAVLEARLAAAKARKSKAA